MADAVRTAVGERVREGERESLVFIGTYRSTPWVLILEIISMDSNRREIVSIDSTEVVSAGVGRWRRLLAVPHKEHTPQFAHLVM